jgi:hypothetical protein
MDCIVTLRELGLEFEQLLQPDIAALADLITPHHARQLWLRLRNKGSATNELETGLPGCIHAS